MSDIRENIKQVLKEYTEEELYDYKPNFSAEDLLKYIESEWDIEMLEMIDSKIQDRIGYLTQVLDVGTRTKVTGFKRYDD
jgi:hypothetical protein